MYKILISIQVGNWCPLRAIIRNAGENYHYDERGAGSGKPQMSCFFCEDMKLLKSKYVKNKTALRRGLWCGRFTLLKVVLRTRLFFPFKLCPWQLRATKQLTKQLLLVDIHEPRKDKYTALLWKSYKSCDRLPYLIGCQRSKMVIIVQKFLTMVWNVFMFVSQWGISISLLPGKYIMHYYITYIATVYLQRQIQNR